MAAHLLVPLLVGLTSSTPVPNSDDICRLFPDKTNIADPSSCYHYITCNNSVSQYTRCAASTPYFDNSTMKCTKALSDDNHCQLSCLEHVGRFISDKTSCKGYYFCEDETTPVHGKCPNDLHFNLEAQSCIYKSKSNCKLSSFDICSVVKNDTKIANENDCRKYYQCTKKGLTVKNCESGEYYNSNSGICLEKWKVNCPKIPLPDKVCGTERTPLKNKFVSDDATCRGYFYCANKGSKPDPAPVWGQCKNDTFFDPNEKSCADPLKVKCPTGADRCDGRSLTFVSGNQVGCRQYLRCKNGKTIEENGCGNYFFDEILAACVSTPITYKSCVRKGLV